MTTPYSVSDNSPVLPADVNQYKNILEGATGYTDTFVMVATTGTNYVIRLGDAAGTNKLSIQNSASVEKAYIDSNGALSVTTFSAASGTLILPQSATPSQTAEGSVSWDTDDDRLTVGTGAATKIIGLSRGAGLAASATQEMTYDTTAAQFKVWDGSTSQSIGPTGSFYDLLRTSFRANRHTVADFSATEHDEGGVVGSNGGVAIGLGYTGAPGALASISGEPAIPLGQGTGASGLLSISNDAVYFTALSPNHSPRMLIRFAPPAASANVTDFLVGFVSANSATPNGACIRIVTTGHPFFVTRQGGSETTFDMGAQTAGVVVGYEIETADAGVTWVLRNQAGTALATQTTNVPTAATGLGYGIVCSEATGAIAWSVAYLHVDGTFA